MIELGRDYTSRPKAVLDHEWLVTNGMGGYASSSVACANTRRYHGLLVASLGSTEGRLVLLSKIDEELEVDRHVYYLGTNEYPNDTIHPIGYVHMDRCHLEGSIPVFTYSLPDAVLEKRVWMEHGHNTTYVSYKIVRATGPVKLKLILFANYKDHHWQTQGSSDWNFQVTPIESGCEITARPGAMVYRVMASTEATFTPTGIWYWHFVHRRELERGMDYMEDLYMPGCIEMTLSPGQTEAVIITTEQLGRADLDHDRALRRERTRQDGLIASAVDALGPWAGTDDFAKQLALAADQFLIRWPSAAAAPARLSKPADSKPNTMIAGYHWFTDWGRDTMISLPGITLRTGRFDVARGVIERFAQYTNEGLLPNLFPETGQIPDYNTVDAGMWYFHAIHEYLARTGDYSLLEAIFPVLEDMIDWHIRGTRYGIKMDEKDGLLRAGEPGVQLTWMDAKIGDWVITPRNGKAVEVCGLWVSALYLMDEWAARLGKKNGTYKELAQKAARSFEERFWFDEGGYLYDVVDTGNGDDSTLRPNQMIALALPHNLMSEDRARSAVNVVTEKLLTPYGLRTLAPGDPRYAGQYIGDSFQRDSTYHQGPVWPWPMGAYVRAALRTGTDKSKLRSALLPFRDHLFDACLGTISEVFDGDPPHTPRAAVAQAWSVGEVLRSWVDCQE